MSPYSAPWWLPGGHAQTVFASLFAPPPVERRRERWDTPDGDFIDVDFAGDPRGGRLAVLFHGLEGGSDSHYARAFCARAARAGLRVAMPHWRGCSGELNRLPRAYHSGDSQEVDWVLRRFSSQARQIVAVGVSLGGNVLLKWLGEQGDSAKALVHRAAAVSAPLDVGAAGRALDRGLNRLLYTRMFLSTLKPKSLRKLEVFPGLFDAARVGAARTFREFDDLVTAPLHGFRDADQYWSAASSAPHLSGIRVPTLVLNARNDPFLPEQDLLAATSKVSGDVLLEFPRSGGHVGFAHEWLSRHLLDFLLK